MDENYFSPAEETGEDSALDSYNAFAEGIEPGGLRNTAQIKILIGFIVKSLEDSLTKAQIVEVLQMHGLVNYFDAGQSADELISGGSLEENADGKLSITELGRASVEQLESELPRSVREKALNDALRFIAREKNLSENKIEIQPLEKGANVTFTVMGGDEALMKLTVYAADDYQVERIRENFLRDPARLYAGIVSTLFT